MKWSMVMAVMITLARVADAAEPGQLPVIHLQMDDDADVPVAILNKSQDEVARILRMLVLGWSGPRRGRGLPFRLSQSRLGTGGRLRL